MHSEWTKDITTFMPKAFMPATADGEQWIQRKNITEVQKINTETGETEIYWESERRFVSKEDKESICDMADALDLSTSQNKILSSLDSSEVSQLSLMEAAADIYEALVG